MSISWPVEILAYRKTQVVRVKWTHKKNGEQLLMPSQTGMNEGSNNFVDPPSIFVDPPSFLANQMPSVIILIVTIMP